METDRLFASLTYLSPADREQIEHAYQFAARMHADQKRASGEPYIQHCLAVAQILAELHLPGAAVAAGLLHDVVEDTPVTNDDILREFGEDIALLAHTMDDVLDFIHSAADAMFIYKITNPSDRAKELADVIVLAAVELEKAVCGLRHKSEFKKMLEKCVEINRLENAADRIYRAAIGELFDNAKDMVEIIKWREIYEHMETATDRAEDVADVIEGVALKNA